MVSTHCAPYQVKQRLRVIAGEELFTLTQEQIEFDSPSMLSELMLSQNSLDPQAAIELSVHPRLFAIVCDYLRGYDILPLASDALPTTLNPTNALKALAKDAEYLRLSGLIKLLASDQEAHLHLLSIPGHRNLIRTHSVNQSSDEAKVGHNEEWIKSTLFVAQNASLIPCFQQKWTCPPNVVISEGIRLGFSLPTSCDYLLPSSTVSWFHSRNAHIEINGKTVRPIQFTRFQKWLECFFVNENPPSSCYPDCDVVWDALRLGAPQFLPDRHSEADYAGREPFTLQALAKELQFTLEKVDWGEGAGNGQIYAAWIHSMKLVTAPHLASLGV